MLCSLECSLMCVCVCVRMHMCVHTHQQLFMVMLCSLGGVDTRYGGEQRRKEVKAGNYSLREWKIG